MSILPAVVGASLAVGVVAYFWLRRRRPASEVHYHFRCPGCGQKIRYSADKAGRAAACPHCRQRWTFPLTPAATTTDPSTRRLLVGQRVVK